MKHSVIEMTRAARRRLVRVVRKSRGKGHALLGESVAVVVRGVRGRRSSPASSGTKRLEGDRGSAVDAGIHRERGPARAGLAYDAGAAPDRHRGGPHLGLGPRLRRQCRRRTGEQRKGEYGPGRGANQRPQDPA